MPMFAHVEIIWRNALRVMSSGSTCTQSCQFFFHFISCIAIASPAVFFSNSFIFYSLACIAVFSLSTRASHSNPFSFIHSYALQSSRFLLLHLSHNLFSLTDMFSSYMPSLSFSDTFLSCLFLSLALHYSNLCSFCTAVLKASFSLSPFRWSIFIICSG